MRVVVVGAGAWGLPTAAELVRRGHDVTLVDRYGPGNPLSSSGGPTRLWRVADPDPAAIRLGRRAVSALERLEDRTRAVAAHEHRPAVARRDRISAPDPRRGRGRGSGTHRGPRRRGRGPLPRPRARREGRAVVPRGRRAAGRGGPRRRTSSCSIAAAGSRGSARRSPRPDATPSGASISLDDGRTLDAEAVVVCAGPGTPGLLPGLGLDVPLRAFLEQVVHLGDAGGSSASRRAAVSLRRSDRRGGGHLLDADAGRGLQDRHRRARCASSWRATTTAPPMPCAPGPSSRGPTA